MPDATKQRAKPSTASDRWKPVGWQGITARVPTDWNLVAFGGDHESGNFRLDNGALSAGHVVGMEVRWSSDGARVTAEQIDKRLKNYLTSITRTARKQKITSDTRIKEIAPEEGSDRPVQREFRWRADQKGVGRIWRCSTCGRVVIAQVVGDRTVDLESLGAVSVAGMKCHGGEWESWRLYSLNTSAPAEFTLRGQPQLMNVYIHLLFQRGRTSDTLSIEQWGVADVQLRNSTLLEWYERKGGLASAGLTVRRSESEQNGHAACTLTGTRSGIGYWLGKGMQQVVRLQRPAVCYRARLWECPEGNTIHLVQLSSRSDDVDQFDQIVHRTLCH